MGGPSRLPRRHLESARSTYLTKRRIRVNKTDSTIDVTIGK